MEIKHNYLTGWLRWKEQVRREADILNLSNLKRKSVLPFKPVMATLPGAKAHSSVEP